VLLINPRTLVRQSDEERVIETGNLDISPQRRGERNGGCKAEVQVAQNVQVVQIDSGYL
jgi:hypothetical protein